MLMTKRLRKNLTKLVNHNSVLRYILVGGCAYLLEMIVLALLTRVLSIEPTIAVSISFWIGVVVSFFMQKVIAFENNHKSPKKVGQQIVMYASLLFINYVFTITLVYLLESMIGVLLSRTIAIVVSTVWNYVVYKRIIFRN